MNITWHGQSCFKIVYQKGKGETASILVDPFSKEIGIRPPKFDADVIISQNSALKKEFSDSAFLISGPGEYDAKSAYIHGLAYIKENPCPVFIIEAEDIRICHLGEMGKAGLSESQIEEIGEIDILLLPVGNEESLKEAIKAMSEIEPKITIPMNFKISGLKVKLSGVDAFLKTLGIKSLESLPKLNIKKKDIAVDEAKIIQLQP